MSDDKTTAADRPAGATAEGPGRLDALRGLAGTVGEGFGALAARLPRPKLSGRGRAGETGTPGTPREAAGPQEASPGASRLPAWAARALDRVPVTGLLTVSAVVIWGLVWFNYWR